MKLRPLYPFLFLMVYLFKKNQGDVIGRLPESGVFELHIGDTDHVASVLPLRWQLHPGAWSASWWVSSDTTGGLWALPGTPASHAVTPLHLVAEVWSTPSNRTFRGQENAHVCTAPRGGH